MTPRSLINRLRGFHELEKNRQIAEWERTRWAAAVGLSVYAKKGQKIKPQDLAVFPWENPEKKLEVTDEAAQRRWERWDKQLLR